MFGATKQLLPHLLGKAITWILPHLGALHELHLLLLLTQTGAIASISSASILD
jgi:hypothetical protein